MSNTIYTRPPPPPPLHTRPAPPPPHILNDYSDHGHAPRSMTYSSMHHSWSHPGPSSSPPLQCVDQTPSPLSVPLRGSPPPLDRRVRSRSRDIFPSWRALRGKHGQRAETVDEPMLVESPSSSIPPVNPPSLPSCALEAAFQCSDTNDDIPPAFYPGQAIPTILTFRMERDSSLSHSLNPTLTMSLVGTLHLPNSTPRTIICVSVSLSEGLELWARDAQYAYATRPDSPTYPSVDPATCLPGGTYSLPLTVQVPNTPKLPPSFNVAEASFAVTYALSVTLSCDDPIRPDGRVCVAETSRGFEMMPETLPTRTPRYSPTSFWVRGDRPATAPERRKSLSRRPNTRWTVEPFLPTTSFSPTSLIPIKIRLTPPSESEDGSSVVMRHQIFVRLAVIRREHSSTTPAHFQDPSGQSGLLREVEVASRYAWFESASDPIEFESTVPLMVGDKWTHGFSTMLNVGPGNLGSESAETITVSSTFHLAATLAFLPLSGERHIEQVVPVSLPEKGVFTEPAAWSFEVAALKRMFPGTIRTLPLPIVVGSVSEPRSAMQLVRWSDLHLERSASGEEIGRIISGEVLTCEDGWIQAPPSYDDAIETAPYEY